MDILDKLHANMLEAGKQHSRWSIMTVMLSLILLGVSSEIFVATEKMQFIGISVSISKFNLLVGLISSIIFTYCSTWVHDAHEKRLKDALKRLYFNGNNEVELTEQEWDDFMGHESSLTLLVDSDILGLTKKLSIQFFIFSAIVFVVLAIPFVAVCYGFYNIYLLSGVTLLGTFFFIATIIVMVVYPARAIFFHRAP